MSALFRRIYSYVTCTIENFENITRMAHRDIYHRKVVVKMNLLQWRRFLHRKCFLKPKCITVDEIML